MTESSPAASQQPEQLPSASTRGRRRAELPAPGRDRSWLAWVWYRIARLAILVVLMLRGGIRVTGREHLPAEGGGLILSNHLSHFDVFALGVGVPRPLNFVARSTLFKPVLGFLISSLGGFPIEREGGGLSGLRETLRRLRAGGLVLIFPEGTRSHDGEIGELKTGIAALARARVPFIPAAVAGTFEVFPRGSRFPRSHPIHVHFGTPIEPETLATLSADDLTHLLRQRMLEAQVIARSHLARV